MSFGSRLKEARKAKKLTQSEVASKLGIDDTTISKYENDKSEPDNETLKKLSALYECSIDHLMGKPKQSVDEEKHPAVELSEYLDMGLTNEDIKKRMDFFAEFMQLNDEQVEEFLSFVRWQLSKNNPVSASRDHNKQS